MKPQLIQVQELSREHPGVFYPTYFLFLCSTPAVLIFLKISHSQCNLLSIIAHDKFGFKFFHISL